MKSLMALVIGLALLPFQATGTEAPVSQTEAATIFSKAEHVMKDVLQLKISTPAFPKGTGVATRSQILKHFAALYTALEPKFKFSTPAQRSAAGVISLKDPQIKLTALRLETLGFIDRYGPLVTSKSDGLLPNEFGDALGYFMARVAELTHTPSTKFSPYLSPP
jgi:hypothetical protein